MVSRQITEDFLHIFFIFSINQLQSITITIQIIALIKKIHDREFERSFSDKSLVTPI